MLGQKHKFDRLTDFWNIIALQQSKSERQVLKVFLEQHEYKMYLRNPSYFRDSIADF